MTKRVRKRQRSKAEKQGWSQAWVNELRGYHGRWAPGGAGPARAAAQRHQRALAAGLQHQLPRASAGATGSGPSHRASETRESSQQQARERAAYAEAKKIMQEVHALDRRIEQLRDTRHALRAQAAGGGKPGAAAGAAAGGNAARQGAQAAAHAAAAGAAAGAANVTQSRVQQQVSSINQQIKQLQQQRNALLREARQLFAIARHVVPDVTKENRVPVLSKAATLTGAGEVTYVSFPIEKTETTPDGDLLVYGKATDGSVDSDEQIVDPKFSEEAIRKWLNTGPNIRVQHNPQLYPAGVGIEMDTDSEGATWVKSLIVEPTAKRLVEKGALRAYSVGIARPTIVRDAVARGGRITSGEIVEISLVDRPANKNCGIQLVKAGSNGEPEWVGKVFGADEIITKYAGDAETVTVELPSDVNITFTPNDLAKTLNRKYGTQAVPQEKAADGKKPYGDVTYADPGYQKDGVKRYPLDTETHVRAAWSYINMPRNAKKYSPDQLKKIKSRIKAAMRRHGAQLATNGKTLEARLIKADARATKLLKNDQADDQVRAALTQLRSALDTAMRAQASDPDYRTDPQDAQVWAHLEDLENALHEADRDQAMDVKGSKPKKKKLPLMMEADATKKQKVICAGCGAKQNAKHNMCSECGSGLENAVPVHKNHDFVCLGCGGELDKGEKFCPKCGKSNPGYLPEADQKIPANKTSGSGVTEVIDSGVQEPGSGDPQMDAAMRLKSAGAPRDLGVLHDLACPAYKWDDVLAVHPDANFAGMELTQWQAKALDAAANGSLEAAMRFSQLWQHAVTLKGTPEPQLREVKDALNKAFQDANPGPGHFPTPGHVTATQFRRPLVNEGHETASSGHAGPNTAHVPTEGANAADYHRDYISSGHADESAGHGGGDRAVAAPRFTGVPTRVDYSKVQEGNAHQAMVALHDHIAHTFPDLCPMGPPSTVGGHDPTATANKQRGTDAGPENGEDDKPAFEGAAPAFNGRKPKKGKKGKNGKKASKCKSAKTRRKTVLKGKKGKKKKGKLPGVSSQTMPKPGKLPEPSGKPGVRKKLKVKVPPERDAERNGNGNGDNDKDDKKSVDVKRLIRKAVAKSLREAQANQTQEAANLVGQMDDVRRAARKAAKRKVKRSLRASMAAQTQAAQSGSAAPSGAQLKRMARKAAAKSLRRQLASAVQPPVQAAQLEPMNADLAGELKKSRRELKKQFAAQQEMLKTITTQNSRGEAPEIDVTPIREASAALAGELRRSRKEFARFKAERKHLDAVAAIQPAETASPEFAEASQRIQEGNTKLAGELRKSRRELNAGFRRQQRMFKNALAERNAVPSAPPEQTPAPAEPERNVVKAAKKASASQIKEASASLTAELRKTRKDLNTKFKAQRDRLEDLSRQPDFDHVIQEMQLKAADSETRKASQDAAAELRSLRTQLSLLAARGQQPQYVPLPPAEGNGRADDRILAELRKMRKSSAKKDAQIKKFKSKAAKAYKIADQLAGQPDPGLAPFKGIAQNVLKSAAAPARPADVQSVADYAERTQVMMLRELENQARFSEHPAEREAAWRAVLKMRGITEDGKS